MPVIGTTRFTDETWDENVKWRVKNNYLNGCVYGTPKVIRDCVTYQDIVYVLEMNNDINKIMGIGKIKNKIQVGMSSRKCKIYNDRFYCKFIYAGKKRVDRFELSERENIIIQILDILVFKSKCHIKRGHGITRMTPTMLNKAKGIDLLDEIKYMFTRRGR